VTDYEKICDFQNLYQAHLRARRGKRDKPEVIRFELNMASELSSMQRALEARSYKMHGYYHFIVHEPKRREIFAAYYPDRVLLHCVCSEVLIPVLQKRLIHDNAACQEGKGIHFAIRRFSGFMREHYKYHGAEGYVLKCDVSKYFASIDHGVLKRQLEKVMPDREIMALLAHYIDSYSTAGRPGKGLPLGNQSSQWFGIYHLDGVDRLIKEVLRVRHYVRYMDDLLLIHRDKAFLQDALHQIRGMVEDSLNLELNGKTQITPLRGGVEFMGWRFYLTDTGKVIRKLKTQSKLRFKRRLKKIQKDYAAGLLELEDVKHTLASYHGHLKHGHTYKLTSKAFREFVLKRELPN
jgi:hypothetical protein